MPHHIGQRGRCNGDRGARRQVPNVLTASRARGRVIGGQPRPGRTPGRTWRPRVLVPTFWTVDHGGSPTRRLHAALTRRLAATPGFHGTFTIH